MTTTHTDTLRAQVEQGIWELSGWRADQAALDRLLSGDHCGRDGHTPCCQPPAEAAPHACEPEPEPESSVSALPALVMDADGGVWQFLGAPRVGTLPQPDPPQSSSSVGGGMRRCRRCGVVKPLDGFHRDAKDREGRKGACRVCEAERKRRHSSSGTAG